MNYLNGLIHILSWGMNFIAIVLGTASTSKTLNFTHLLWAYKC